MKRKERGKKFYEMYRTAWGSRENPQLTVSKTPAPDRDPRLQPVKVGLECGETAVQRGRVRVHGRDLEGARVEEGEGKVEVGKAVQVQVLWRHGLARLRVGPRLVVADRALANRVAIARRPGNVSAAAETSLAAGAAEVGG